MFEGRDPSFEIVNEVNRAFVVESGPMRPIINFPQSEQAGRKFKFQQKWYEEFNWLEYILCQKMLRFASLADVLVLLVREMLLPCYLSIFHHCSDGTCNNFHKKLRIWLNEYTLLKFL